MLQRAGPARRALERPLGRLGAGPSRPLRGASRRGGRLGAAKETPAPRFPLIRIRIRVQKFTQSTLLAKEAMRRRRLKPSGRPFIRWRRASASVAQAAGCLFPAARKGASINAVRRGTRGYSRPHLLGTLVCQRRDEQHPSHSSIIGPAQPPRFVGRGVLRYCWTCFTSTHTFTAFGRLLTTQANEAAKETDD
jgi:hypothetical protein